MHIMCHEICLNLFIFTLRRGVKPLEGQADLEALS